jgi:hypothetical protein
MGAGDPKRARNGFWNRYKKREANCLPFEYYLVPVSIFIVILEFGLSIIPCGISFGILYFVTEVLIFIFKGQIFERFCVFTSDFSHF